MSERRRRVRPFRDADFEEVAALWHRTRRPDRHTLDDDRAHLRGTVFAENDVWVCEDGGRIEGYLAFRGDHVQHLYVDAPLRRSGVGRLLMDVAFRASPAALRLHTHRDNAPARAFYERLGFRAVAFGVSPPPESLPDVEYAWRPDA